MHIISNHIISYMFLPHFLYEQDYGYDSSDYDSADYDVSGSADDEDEDLNEIEIWEYIWKKKMTPEEKKEYKSLSKDE